MEVNHENHQINQQMMSDEEDLELWYRGTQLIIEALRESEFYLNAGAWQQLRKDFLTKYMAIVVGMSETIGVG